MRPFLAFLLALAVSACDGTTSERDSFGDPYRLVLDTDATLADGQVSVPVSYGGGCEDHAFTLQSRIAGEVAEVWLVHDANGDTCEALISETVVRTVPTSVASAASVVLRVPATTARDEETAVPLR